MSSRTIASHLDDYIEQWLESQLHGTKGYEREAVMEMVRSADLHGYYLHFFDISEFPDQFAATCQSIVSGIGLLLKAFIPTLEQFGDGIPLLPSNPNRAAWADQTLVMAGQLSMLRRLAYCERYGLVQCITHSDDHISLHVTGNDAEFLDRNDYDWMIAQQLTVEATRQEEINQQLKGWARDRIDQYVYIFREHFIGYDSDWNLLKLYQEQAKYSMLRSPEADAFPDEVSIGPRTFGEWKQIAITGVSRAMLHLSFATRLYALNKDKLDLRNLLTVPVRYEDLIAIWHEQTGVTDSELEEVSDIFMMSSNHAKAYYSNCDYPLPYSIRFGKYFALLPQFGYLQNVASFLITELKRKYRRDWDKAVNAREAKFRDELYSLFSNEFYVSGRGNFKIRQNGKELTDIDAILFEASTNTVYLIQLKWFDVFGHSLKERESKLSNLLHANKWIEKVDAWLKNMPQAELVELLGLKKVLSEVGSIETRMMVLTRYSARFSGNHHYDARAAWISWPRLCKLASESENQKSRLAHAWKAAMSDSDFKHSHVGEQKKFIFPGLRVDLHY